MSDFDHPLFRTQPGGYGARPKKMNRCVMLQYDQEEKRWRDLLRKTPRPGRAPRPRRVEAHSTAAPSPSMFSNEVLHVGLALTFLPPLGIVLAWASQAISREGKIAITAIGAFVAATYGIVGILALWFFAK